MQRATEHNRRLSVGPSERIRDRHAPLPGIQLARGIRHVHGLRCIQLPRPPGEGASLRKVQMDRLGRGCKVNQGQDAFYSHGRGIGRSGDEERSAVRLGIWVSQDPPDVRRSIPFPKKAFRPRPSWKVDGVAETAAGYHHTAVPGIDEGICDDTTSAGNAVVRPSDQLPWHVKPIYRGYISFSVSFAYNFVIDIFPNQHGRLPFNHTQQSTPCISSPRMSHILVEFHFRLPWPINVIPRVT